jgi:hypothetical protein
MKFGKWNAHEGYHMAFSISALLCTYAGRCWNNLPNRPRPLVTQLLCFQPPQASTKMKCDKDAIAIVVTAAAQSYRQIESISWYVNMNCF